MNEEKILKKDWRKYIKKDSRKDFKKRVDK